MPASTASSSRLRRYVAFLRDAKKPLVLRLAAAFAGVAAIGSLVLLGALLVLMPFTPGFSALEHAKVQHPSVVLAADGSTVLADFRRRNREWVPLSAVDTTAVLALVATEDHRFYHHPGVDLWRLVGATGRTLLGDRQGGSTIPMQLARNLYPERIGRAPGPLRKLMEVVTALKIEAVYTKAEILEAYLNTVPFLYNVHGIELAAQTYFGKPARALTIRESATLIGMLKATSYYNPARNPERARVRRNVVLGQMARHGVVSPAYYEKLKDDPLELRFQPRRFARPNEAPHFTAHVRQQVRAWAREHGYDLYTDGLVIHTPLDPVLQATAEGAVQRQGNQLQAVADVEWGRAGTGLLSRSPADYVEARRRTEPFAHFWQAQEATAEAFVRSTGRFRRLVAGGASEAEALRRLRADAAFVDSLRAVKMRLEAGFVALDPATGQVRAWVGSRDFWKDQFDHVAVARRQPGSTFKPFLYAAALERGVRPGDRYPDGPVEVEMEDDRVWRLASAGPGDGAEATVTVREGLARSDNALAARLVQEVGARRTARMAHRLGVRQSALDAVPSLALGTSAVTLLEMAAAYATIANGGVYRAPQLVTRIEDAEGTVLATFEPEPERVLDEETAVALLDMMRDVIDRGTGRAVRNVWGVRADVAGKTGTTQGNADGWFLMMHPQLVAGAWMGFNDPRVTFRSDYWGEGAHNALRVVGDFYRQALRRGQLSPKPAFETPPPTPAPGPDGWSRAGEWLTAAAATVGAGLREAGLALAAAVGGWFEQGEDAGRDERLAEAAPPPTAEAPARAETEEARRRRMERYWEEVQRDRQQEAERVVEQARGAVGGWIAREAERLQELPEVDLDELEQYLEDLERAGADLGEARRVVEAVQQLQEQAREQELRALERRREREAERREREAERREREEERREGW